MTKYHVNPETGRPNRCKADKQPCAYAVDGQEPPHYATKEDAKAGYSKTAEQEYGAFKTNTRALKSALKESEIALAEATAALKVSQEALDQAEKAIQDNKNLKKLRTQEKASAVRKYYLAKERAKHYNETTKDYEARYDKYVSEMSATELDRIVSWSADKDASGSTIYEGVSVIKDTVEHEGVEYRRLSAKEGTFPDAPYSFRLQFGKELTPQQAQHIGALFGYGYSTTGGEGSGPAEQDQPNSVVISADTTKGRAYKRLDDFLEKIPELINDGSPVRKTDRAGEGTKGTRLVKGMGDLGYIEIYADSISSTKETLTKP